MDSATMEACDRWVQGIMLEPKTSQAARALIQVVKQPI